MLSNRPPYQCRICGSTEHKIGTCSEIRIPRDKGFFKLAGQVLRPSAVVADAGGEEDHLLLAAVAKNYSRYYALLRTGKYY